MATFDFTPTTKLEAVNLMLSCIGESPLHTLEVTGLVDAAVAQQILHETMRHVQSRRWNFNYETEYPLTPDVNGYINLPTNALAVDASDIEALDVVVRGSRLYDRTNRTYVFTRSVKCDITFFLTFEELPEVARYYISVLAAHTFQGRIQGSSTQYRFTAETVAAAHESLQHAAGDSDDANILTGSLSVGRVLRRTP